jgi:hypothetical protein
VSNKGVSSNLCEHCIVCCKHVLAVRLEISEGSINQGIYALLCLIIRFAQVRSENGYSFFFVERKWLQLVCLLFLLCTYEEFIDTRDYL